MIEFFREGGFGMWPILLISLVLLGGSAYFAYRPVMRRLGFLGALSAALVFAAAGTTWADVGTVLHAVVHDERFKDEDKKMVLLEGLKECTRPGSFATAMLMLAAVLVAVGLARRPQRADGTPEPVRAEQA